MTPESAAERTGEVASEARPEGVRFSEIQRLLALFSQGIAGQHLHLKPHDMPFGQERSRANQRRHFTVEPEGERIHLPAEIASFDSFRHNFGAYRIVVLHQVGYLEFGTFEFDLAEMEVRLRRSNTVLPVALPESQSGLNRKRRWPAARTSELERFFARWPRPVLLRRIFIILEDLRVDTAIRRHYPGARADLDRVLAHALAARPQVAPQRHLSALLDSLLRFSLGAERVGLIADDKSGLLGDVLDAAAALTQPRANVYDSARVGLDLRAMLDVLLRRPLPLYEARSDTEFMTAKDPPPTEASVAGDQAGGLSAADMEGEAAREDEEDEEDLDLPGVAFRGELRTDRVYRHAGGGTPGGVTREAQSAAGDDPPSDVRDAEDSEVKSLARGRTVGARRSAREGPQSFLYDEWDCHARIYLRAWCRVYEHRLRGEDFSFVTAARERNAALANQIQRQFSFIKPDAFRRVHRASDGDELELDAMIDAVIDRRSGHATDETLYLRRDRGLRNVCAAFLVDMSASTDFPIPDPLVPPLAAPDENDVYLWGRSGVPLNTAPSAPRRRVIDVSKDALVLMCDALARLGDSHAVYGFSGGGRDNVEVNVVKDFGDRLSARTWAALASMTPRGSTRMGPAIRHACAKLARQPERKKVLIIVSDGYPEDSDYGPERNDREYGILDTARALQEAERAGISTFCVTIDPAGRDYLRRMCAENRYLVIDDVAALPAELSKVYRALTRETRRPAPTGSGNRRLQASGGVAGKL